jgi:IS605 OrfB family transposase
MKLTATLKLLPNDQQRDYLFQTLERANAACNWMSQQAWETKTFNTTRLHHLTYYVVREQFALGSQITVRCIGKVIAAYKTDKRVKRQFKKLGAIAYDSHNLTFKRDQRQVVVWTVGGRLTIDFTAGASQLALLQHQQGETDLVYRKGAFYLLTTCNVPDNVPMEIEGFLGVDLGVKHIAVDSDGNIHSAKHLLNVRHRHRRLRKKLQQKGTDSARRLLKRLSGKEKRFARDVNHCISKQLVAIAKGTQRGLALEDLQGIRDRVNVPRKRRDELHNWSFHKLRAFVEYKAKRCGVPLVLVDPCNTSRTCPCCGCVDKRNRLTQAKFSCISCGFVAHADYVAAVNISRRGAVNHPHVGSVSGYNPT